jgi:single-strand DNA-binding protein
MASYNKVILVGNLTRDPEVKYLQSGTAVCDLGLAINDKRKNAQGEWCDDVVFVDCVTFGRTAEVAGEYLTKGSPVLIEGRLKLDTWQAQDGSKRSKLKVVCERLQMLGAKREAAPRQQDAYSEPEEPAPWDRDAIAETAEMAKNVQPNDDDIPF